MYEIWPILNYATNQNESKRAETTQNNPKAPKWRLTTSQNEPKQPKTSQNEIKGGIKWPKTRQNETKRGKRWHRMTKINKNERHLKQAKTSQRES